MAFPTIHHDDDIPCDNSITINARCKSEKLPTLSLNQSCCDTTRNRTHVNYKEVGKDAARTTDEAKYPKKHTTTTTTTTNKSRDIKTTNERNEWKLVGKNGKILKPGTMNKDSTLKQKKPLTTSIKRTSDQKPKSAQRLQTLANDNIQRKCLLISDTDFSNFKASLFTRMFAVDSHKMENNHSALKFLQTLANLSSYETIYIHMGTKELACGESPKSVSLKFQEIITTIRQKATSIRICICEDTLIHATVN